MRGPGRAFRSRCRRMAASERLRFARTQVENAPHEFFQHAHFPMKTKTINEAQFLALLQKVLKATNDPQLATTIYDEVAREVQLVKNIASFEKFCEKGALPDLEPQTVSDFQNELSIKFGEENVEVTPDPEAA